MSATLAKWKQNLQIPLHKVVKKSRKTKSRKELLGIFHLNGHTFGFHPRTQKLEPPCTAQ